MNTPSLDSIYQRFFSTLLIEQTSKQSYVLPDSIGRGGFKRVTSFSGLEIVFSDFYFKQKQTKRFSTHEEMVELQFIFDGEREVWVSGSTYEMKKGISSFLFMKDFEAVFQFSALDRTRTLALGIPVPLFQYYLEQETGQNRISFQSFLKRGRFRKLDIKLDAMSEHLVQRIIEEISGSDHCSLTIESKALELLSRYIRLLMFDSGHNDSTRILSRNDIMKVHQAAELMVARMSNPPSLLELAHLVRLNDYKLKRGFKELYGTTVFGFLREKRFEYALDLLRKEQGNVTQVASEVGYNNLSAFSKGFREKFGVSPSLVRRYY
ncbi:helix-turn-helix transcriptional regulator [Caldalkalibacillus mannanilyticus]|uniref:helix-turn-helix transcriptional regulator n=1 Tax=Caldalkalibacillus mannanilyticus TaxID=1418 RepID=UPI0004699BD1|nr:AraC family transcriptional regulator [Caldalkalibacillus mannanilyticus]